MAKATAVKAKPGLLLKKKRFVGLKPTGTRPILVELPGGPKIVVQATNVEDAWEQYKAVCGVRSSDHKPRFSRPGEDCLTNEAGVVVNQLGNPVLADLKKPDDGKGDWNLDEEEVD